MWKEGRSVRKARYEPQCPRTVVQWIVDREAVWLNKCSVFLHFGSHPGISPQLIWPMKAKSPRNAGAGRAPPLRQPTPLYFRCETVMRAIPSWQTRFAMPVRCALLAQHPFTVSSSNGPRRSTSRKKRWTRCIALCCVGCLHVCESSPLILPHLASPRQGPWSAIGLDETLSPLLVCYSVVQQRRSLAVAANANET